jgi:uncharacterized protein (DUF1330 family)
MRKNATLIGIILLTLGLNVNAQDKFTTYDNAYAKKTYDIQISLKDNDKFTFYIDAMSLDNLHEKGGFMVDDKKYQGFIDALTEAKSKYQEWEQTAKSNNVKELDKEMPIKSKVAGYFLYGSDWHFQYIVNLTFDFKILESEGEIKYLLIVRSGKMQSSSNQFMDVDGVVLVFTSANEIQEFVDSISLNKINEFRNKPKSEDLFK